MGTGKAIYVGGTLFSIVLSLYLYMSGRRETGIFVVTAAGVEEVTR